LEDGKHEMRVHGVHEGGLGVEEVQKALEALPAKGKSFSNCI
jgi:hypothetical protein